MDRSFRILHISDLHRSPHDPISNGELISALISDRDRYRYESPAIGAPDAIVVSGDIIQGVPLRTPDYEARLAEQYASAASFLDELAQRFLGGDRSRLVIVPGNHDVDWNTAFAAMSPVSPDDLPSDLGSALRAVESPYRWDWKTRTLYKIVDQLLYERRLECFWDFFGKFYDGVPGLLHVKRGGDFTLHSLCDDRIVVAGFNSCHGNDCFAYHGEIRRDAVARSHLALEDCRKIFDLRIAVWHHSIDGSPSRTDYMDMDIVRGMIGRGYRLGLYGHQHIAHAAGHQIWLSEQETMAATSAGSLCAGAKELPTGTFRQYSILEIARDFCSVRVHVRQMSVANLFAPAYQPKFGGKTFLDLSWKRPLNALSEEIDSIARRRQRLIDEAEAEAKEGDRSRTIALLRSLPLPAGSYERDLMLGAATATGDWATVVEVTDPPSTIAELVQRVDALDRMGRARDAIADIDRFAEGLGLPISQASELRRRLTAKEAIRG